MEKILFNKRLSLSTSFPKILILIIILQTIKYGISRHKKLIKVDEKMKNFKSKVCLCTIAKDEDLYINDFLKYYKELEYDHIFIYDNNDINVEKLEDVIKDYINIGFVTLIDYRGYRGKENRPQLDAYYDCYEKHNKEYDWLTFFDFDEYLILKPNGTKIHEFLESERFKNCPIVKINWVIYSDNGQIKYENKSLMERFTEVSNFKPENYYVKSIMRGNISYDNYNRSYNPHYLYYNVKSCSSSGRVIKGTYYSYIIDYNFAILNHYNTKTITEYTKKLKRGRPTMKMPLYNVVLKYYFNRFFGINNKTKEKVEIFNKAFNTSFE